MPEPPAQPDPIRRVVCETPAGSLADARAAGLAPAADAGALRLRRALGLPADAPIILTGHQPGAWHAGIVAKELAADAIADGLADLGVVAAAITVDHQPVPLTIRLPTRDADGLLHATDRPLPTPTLTPPTADADTDRAIGWLPAFEPRPLDQLSAGLAIDPAETRLRDYHAALLAGRTLGSAADQLTHATEALLAPVLRRPMHRFPTSAMARTPDFAALVRAMLEDAPACVRAYNAAVADDPGPGIAPLDDRDPDNPELPLWLLDAHGRAARGFVRNIAAALAEAPVGPRPTILPRALTMTGFLRRYAADVFIHGTGGGAYDRITERWLRDWLGWELSPVLIVTADVVLPIHARPSTESDVAGARWLAHHAEHNPGAVGDALRDERKRSLLRAIAARVAAGEDASAAYADLHDLLREHRSSNRAALAALHAEAAAAARRLAERDLANDRAWAAALLGADTLRALRARLAGALERCGIPGSEHLGPRV